MGSGKGERKFWKCPVTTGMILFELGDVSYDQAVYVLNVISRRLPFSTKIVKIVY
jgi:ribosomal protein L16/L10AE